MFIWKTRAYYEVDEIDTRKLSLLYISLNFYIVDRVFELYYKFSLLSGVYVNPDKTEIIKVGPHRSDPEAEINVTYGQRSYSMNFYIKSLNFIHN